MSNIIRYYHHPDTSTPQDAGYEDPRFTKMVIPVKVCSEREEDNREEREISCDRCCSTSGADIDTAHP